MLISKINLKFIIFVSVGLFNTILDLLIYVILFEKTKSILLANLIATSIAMVSSYFLNSQLTFKNKKWSIKQFVLFIIITAFGLWVIQTGLIYLLTILLRSIPDQFWQLFQPYSNIVKIALPKIIAIGISFMWNYIWYDKFIFKKSSPAEKIVSSLE